MEKQLADKLASLSTNKDEDEKTMDEFLEKIKNEYKSNWTEDNWEEEFEKHPLFMTKAPEADSEGNFAPEIEAIRQLQWDPDLNGPREIANKYKDEGNLYFKCSKYKSAVDSYSEALKQNFEDNEFKSVLHSNRAAAHYHIRNYRSALADCVQARKLNGSNFKPVMKGAECCLYLRMFDDCVKWCDDALAILDKSSSDEKKNEENRKKLNDLRTRAQIDKKAFERDMRKKEASERKKAETHNKLLSIIKSKGVRIQEKDKEFATMIENPVNPHQKVVSLVNESELVWPVVFLYPEFGQTDLIESFNENNTLEDNLKLMFPNSENEVQSPEWDIKKEYTLKTIQIYYENRDKHKLVKLRKNLTLAEILRSEGMVVQMGTPNFIIMVRDSPFEKLYLQKYNEL